MEMIPALIIIALLSWFFLAFRAFASFNLIMIGGCMLLAVAFGADPFFTTLGLPMLIAGLLISFVTSLKAERSARGRYMVHLFLYGLFLFLRLCLILSIIGIAFAAFMAKLSHEYREMIIVDCAGNRIGKAVVDVDSMTDIHGNSYAKPYDDDLY